MLDIGWSELLVIAVVAIIFVGPRDLIPMLRTFGQYAAKLKKMAGEFQSQFNDALREAELDDIQKTVSDVRNMTPLNALKDQFESEMGDIGKLTEGIKPGSTASETARPASAKKPAGTGSSRKASGTGAATGDAKKTPARKAPAKKNTARTGAGKTPARKTSAGKASGGAAAKKRAAGADKPGAAGGEA
jgi:sec-independent protein translocase protein TatB